MDERTRLHADDFGITTGQAEKILQLTAPLGGPLSSLSIFVNSPVFEECATMLVPYARQGNLIVRPHLNLVEGPCTAPASHVPLLVDDRGMFRRDFVGLMQLAKGSDARAFRLQVREECAAQISCFLQAFPFLRDGIELDSHQHTHMIPTVLDAILQASSDCGCTVSYIRIPVEPWEPHKKTGHADRFASLNTAKNLLLGYYAKRCWSQFPASSQSSVFSGIVLSGHMEDLDFPTFSMLQRQAMAKDGMLEVLFHPVSMQPQECLDPQNAPFTAACCSAHRDAEARHLLQMRTW